MIIHHQFGYCILLADPMECMKWAECILLYSNNLIRQVTTREPQIPGEIWPFSGERSGHSRALPSTKSLWDGVGDFFWPEWDGLPNMTPEKMSFTASKRCQVTPNCVTYSSCAATCSWEQSLELWEDAAEHLDRMIFISSRVNLGCCEPLVFWSLGVNTILVSNHHYTRVFDSGVNHDTGSIFKWFQTWIQQTTTASRHQLQKDAMGYSSCIKSLSQGGGWCHYASRSFSNLTSWCSIRSGSE